jgi:hemerythrin
MRLPGCGKTLMMSAPPPGVGMDLQWDNSLSVGHPLIDAQHRDLFTQFGELLAACEQGQGLARLRQLFEFLDAYVIEHFHAEEALMAQHRYPQMQEHQAAHRMFSARLAALQTDLTENGPSVPVLIHTNKALIYWLTEHIRKVDSHLADFLWQG